MIRLLGMVVLAVLLAACGGGGGGGGNGGDSGSAGPTSISGYVANGAVGNATVQLHSVGSGGQRLLLAQTISGADGSYRFQAQPPAGAVILVTATGGTYVDPATGATVTLSIPIRALDVWGEAARRVSLSAYSEIAVRSMETAAIPDWSAAAVRAANTLVAEWLGVADLLDFRPVDLLTVTDASGFSEQDLNLSLYSGAFSSFAKRVDANASTKLANGLNALHRVVLIDSADDRLFPAFIGGLADFIDLTSLPGDAKVAIKSSLLFDTDTRLGTETLKRGMPRGVSSGTATAPMPADAFQLLGYPGGRTVFNKRGALVAYTTAADVPDWQTLYTASVAEVFGDGEVGIGRWNGGTIASAVRIGQAFEASITFLPYDELPYAVAAVPTAVPGCGVRRLPLVASTSPRLLSDAIGAQRVFVELMPDSTLGLQYLGETFVGADIGLRLPDGSVTRFRTRGGSEAPWASGNPANATLVLQAESTPSTPLSASMRVLVSGAGARKVALRLDTMTNSNDPTAATAVFIAAEGEPDPVGCSPSGVAGGGISPQPENGEHYVFLHAGGDSTFRGAPVTANFGSSGELSALIGVPVLSAPTFELAGNADASIGRVIATRRSEDGTQISRSAPYAVVRPGATVPSSGTVVYDLVASTRVVVDRGGVSSEVPPGSVDSATLQITYGEHPLGSPSAFYGTALLHVAGSVGGFPFVMTGDSNNPSVPLEGLVLREIISGSNFSGAVSAPGGEYAAVEFNPGVGTTPAAGALLFRRRP